MTFEVTVRVPVQHGNCIAASYSLPAGALPSLKMRSTSCG